ncbi:UNVERIFIED_CONTAM: hypothetical protein Sangu_0579400 [Sesamum angustifolium]|uniref:Folate receptor-like domain-containing protein n=1 Tax=Sesamum angustifolium TaxID=2727405 RepID=A0AAW2QAN1_9LAMI
MARMQYEYRKAICPVPKNQGTNEILFNSYNACTHLEEGKPPKKASKGPRDLTLCRVFRKRTCCDVAQTHPAFVSIRRLASSGEASQDCLQLWEVIECSICDPRVGVQRGPPRICATFCDRVYEACATAYFAMDAMTQVLAPCGLGDFVCGRASEWVSNGTELCHAAGFSVSSFDDTEESSCYGGKGSLDNIANSWKTSHSEISPGEQSTWFLEDFKQWIADMPFNERVSWAVGGMVLTAGLLFARLGKYFLLSLSFFSWVGCLGTWCQKGEAIWEKRWA